MLSPRVDACIFEEPGLVVDDTVLVVVEPDSVRVAADDADLATLGGVICIVGRNPDAVWFDDYEDRVIYDEAGLFEYARVNARAEQVSQP